MMFMILLVGGGAVVASRLIFHRWFNHISLYSALWCVSLALFQFRMIQYYPLEPETWILIVSGWLAFLLGSLTFVTARLALRSPNQVIREMPPTLAQLDHERELVRKSLWLISCVALAVAIQHWSIVLKKFGSIEAVLLWGNLLYSFRVQEGLPGSIPYLASLALTGVMLAGVYTAAAGRITMLSVFSFLIVVLIELANMGRAKMVMAALLFLSGYFFYKERVMALPTRVIGGRARQVLSLTLAFVLLLVSAEFVRSTRGGNESFHGSSRLLRNLEGASFITPSLYMYATIHPGVLNQYLKEDQEHTSWGSNTFAPIYRLLAKMGFDTKVNTYQRFYKTPAFANTGTYLRELHADFGIAGVAIGPYILGLLATIWWYRVRERFRFVDCAVATYLFVLVAMTLLYGATRAGDLLTALLGGVIIGGVLDRRSVLRGVSDNSLRGTHA